MGSRESERNVGFQNPSPSSPDKPAVMGFCQAHLGFAKEVLVVQKKKLKIVGPGQLLRTFQDY